MRYRPEEDNDTDFYNKVLDAGRSMSFKILDQFGTNLTDKIQSGQIIAAIDRGFARQFIMKMKEIAGIKQIGVNSRYPYNLLLSLMIVRYFLNFIIIILGFVRLGYWGIAFIPVVILINYLLQASSQVPELKYLFPKLVIFITALGSIYFLIYNTQEGALLIIAIAFHIISITYIITYNYPTKYIKGLILKHPRLIKVLIEEDVVYLIEKSPIINSKPLNKSNDQNSIKPDLPIAGDNMQIVSISEITIENHEVSEWWKTLDRNWKDEILIAAELDYLINDQKLSITNREIEKISLIENLSLDIHKKHWSLQPLTKLVHLKSLYICRDETIINLEPIKSLVNLEDLTCKDIGVVGKKIDFSPISNLQSLKKLDFSFNNILSIDFLTELPNLISLSLDATDIGDQDIRLIGSLKNLISLSISKTDISDISPLQKLTNLRWLYIASIIIPDTQIQEFKFAVPNCKIICS